MPAQLELAAILIQGHDVIIYQGNSMTDTDKKALLEKRDELKSRLVAIENDYRQGLDADSTERAVELENAEVLDAIARSTAEELAKIEEKLAAMP